MTPDLSETHHIHLVGAGGAGMASAACAATRFPDYGVTARPWSRLCLGTRREPGLAVTDAGLV